LLKQTQKYFKKNFLLNVDREESKFELKEKMIEKFLRNRFL
jgi:uncharacterized protein YaaW (UPF0174 family)